MTALVADDGADVRADAERPLRRDAERNRQRILVAADEAFAEGGLEVTLDDIADRAGLGVGTVYRRFADKEELIGALFTGHLDAMLAIADEALSCPDPWDGVVNFFTQSLALQSAHRGLRELLSNGNVGCARVCALRDALLPAMARVMRRAQKAGVLRSDLRETDFPILVKMLGAVANFASTVEPELWRRQLAIILDGLRPARTETQPLPVKALSSRQFLEAITAAKMGRRFGC
jgi:AcrR family transcriptional regulator